MCLSDIKRFQILLIMCKTTGFISRLYCMFNKASLWLANGQNVMEVRRFFYKIQIGPWLVPTHNIVYTVYIREGLWIRVVDYDLDLIFFLFFCIFVSLS